MRGGSTSRAAPIKDERDERSGWKENKRIEKDEGEERAPRL
jgi:hypothetical protein